MKMDIGPELANGMTIKWEQILMGSLAKYRSKTDDKAYLQLLVRLNQIVENEHNEKTDVPWYDGDL